ncbi:metallophosphoesterase family protein [Pedobacter helvus]|uniref:Metallophosphoesterase family protein n=1 Tax=Pedobacter helvus TaxID=2563444 RepID=A0ABW9JMA9_9SPHI|nr:metallophosphoesterase family protein [Pedobacter ureilyticus]
MKIALFSDIHANLPAFREMLADLDSRPVDAVYCLGDLVGYNVWPNEIIAEMQRRKIPTIAGNHDAKVIGLKTLDDNLREPGKKYAYHIINGSGRRYLSTLPAHIRLEYLLDGKPLNIVLAHGSTRSIDEYVLIDTDETYVLELMREANADVLCIGHSHKPYHRVVVDGQGKKKHIINTGSVGKPKDGNPKGCYVFLTVEPHATGNGDLLGVEFIRFDYDIEKAVKAIEDSPLPNEFADMLRQAR